MLRRPASRKPKKAQAVKRRLLLEQLEDRLLMHGDTIDRSQFFASTLLAPESPAQVGSQLGTDPEPEFNHLVVAAGGASSSPSGFVGATYPLSNIPLLSSLPGAAATVYLGFLGHYDAVWGGYSNITTPVFDQDGDATTFSDGELAAIQSIWQAVSEDYSPFNVNVTTVLPPSFANGVAQFIAIGGDGAWTGGSYGGVAYVNSFTNSLSNVSYVFTANLGNGNFKYTADAISHEAGHAFGLQHQSQYAGNGALLNDYYGGPGDGTAPLMGNSYYAPRSLWWYGTSTSSNTYQDDMSVIGRAANGFGYRADDHGNAVNTATALVVSNNQFSRSGIIGTSSDVDFFSFNSGAGNISLSVNVVPTVNNLDARLELRDSSGTLIASASPTNSFNATINVAVGGGSYRLVVASSGGYGNAGQYTVSGTVTTADTFSLFGGGGTPAQVDGGDGQAIEVGVKIRSDVNGYITGLRFYKSAANTGIHTAHLWSSSGQLLATATFTNETASGWQQVNFATPVAISAGVTYTASYHTPTGHYSTTRNFFANGVDSGPLHALANGTSSNGVYGYGPGGFPTQSYQSTNYWVDAVLTTTPPVDNTAPTVSAISPASGSVNVATGATVSVAFSEAMDAATISGTTIRLLDGATPIAATVSYNAGTNTVTLTPSSALANSKTYTVSITGGGSGVKDLAGNALAANVNSSFTTAALSTTYSLFNNTGTPAVIDGGDGQAIELGVRIGSAVNGFITGVRFYKSAANTGTHTGSLWSGSGQLLATATFTNETASGWQQVTFATPVAITAGSTYIASYHTNSGHYSLTRSFFNISVTSGPLYAQASGPHANGVFGYGPGGFPTQSYQSTNYWVDAVLSVVPAVDNTPPTVTSITPASATTNVTVNAAATVYFSEPLDAATVNSSNIMLQGPGGAVVASTLVYSEDFGARRVTLTPTAALASSTAYTIVVRGGSSGVKDVAGNAVAADFTSTFTTAAVGAITSSLFGNNFTPAVIDSGDAQAIEVGVKFQSSTNGNITGLRFYKSAANTGTHTAHLWSSTGQLLATATFTGETGIGWQQVSFATPVAIAAGATYTASYHTTTGHYSATRNYFGAPVSNGPLTALANGGVYGYGPGGLPTQSYQSTNYWVDVLFSTS